MLNIERHFKSLAAVDDDLRQTDLHSIGGLFLEESAPASFVSLICPKSSVRVTVGCSDRGIRRRRSPGRRRRGGFLSVTLSSINDDGGGPGRFGEELSSSSVLGNVEVKNVESENEGEGGMLGLQEVVREEENGVLRRGGGGTFNTAKHLWAGAVAAMVSRFVKLLCFIFLIFSCFYNRMKISK